MISTILMSTNHFAKKKDTKEKCQFVYICIISTVCMIIQVMMSTYKIGYDFTHFLGSYTQ